MWYIYGRTLVIFTPPVSPLPFLHSKCPPHLFPHLSLLNYYYYDYLGSVYRTEHATSVTLSLAHLWNDDHQFHPFSSTATSSFPTLSMKAKSTVQTVRIFLADCLWWTPALTPSLPTAAYSAPAGVWCLCGMLVWVLSSVYPGTAELGHSDIFQASEKLPSRLSAVSTISALTGISAHFWTLRFS